MKIGKLHIFGAVIGLILAVASFLFYSINIINQKIFYFLLILGVVIIFIPFIISLAKERGKERELESRFLEFTRDLVENVKSGTPISKSIINLKRRNYGTLTDHVDKLSNQISSGIPLTSALMNFANDTRSPVIARSVNLISEAEKAGGDIVDILESVSRSVNQTEELKKERRASVYNLIIQGYIIFFIFIIIMLILQFAILPWTSDLAGMDSNMALKDVQVSKGTSPSTTPMFVLILIEAFFTGFVIGKISEGSFKDGIKHSFILLTVTLLISTGANIFFG
ncbi:MAG: type II secretion system F family protein [Nanoarchaeota archaeon]